MTKITLDGRKDTQDYFRLSGVFEDDRLNHTPLLVFVVSGEDVHVRIIDRAAKLLSFPDDTPVMGQWRGEWRSDFFQFTVGDYRQYQEAKDARLNTARNVVKTIGPQGGFRSLTYEYVDANGVTINASAGSRSDAERLEALFAKFGIPVLLKKSS